MSDAVREKENTAEYRIDPQQKKRRAGRRGEKKSRKEEPERRAGKMKKRDRAGLGRPLPLSFIIDLRGQIVPKFRFRFCFPQFSDDLSVGVRIDDKAVRFSCFRTDRIGELFRFR